MSQPALKFSKEELAEGKKYLKDFVVFCKRYLKILDFQGKLIPLAPNKPQMRFIETVLKQLDSIGKIKVVIVKARKMGFSTIITAFIFWVLYTSHDPISAIAGTHAEDSNPVLVNMFKRFTNNLPDKMKPPIGIDNASGMSFEDSGCEYNVKVASNVKKVGRGTTGQLLHISEIAHIDNAEELAASLFSAVADIDRSMIFHESTANGMGNYHHILYTQAEKNDPDCDYIAFFAPWYEDERYTRPLYPGFALDEEEIKEKELYNLADKQMAWRRSMLTTMGITKKQALARFRQEYPANPVEAFQFSAVDSFIPADLVIEAMNRTPYRSEGAIVAGFDPSFKGKDRDAFMLRQDANLWGLETPFFGEDEDARVRYLKDKLDGGLFIDKLFIDAGAGYGIHSRLVNDGYGSRIARIEFGAGADNPLKYPCKRDEMFGDFVDLLTDKHAPLSIKVGEDQRNALLQDMTATGYKIDSKGRPKTESKESMKSRGVASTDLTDAAILTVAQKFVRKHVMGGKKNTVVDNTSVFRC